MSIGTADGDRVKLNQADSKIVRKRSLRLLGSLIRPVQPDNCPSGLIPSHPSCRATADCFRH